MNDFTKFYEKHKVYPARQTIKDMDIHFYKRKMLYQTLGIHCNLIQESRVLEVGPGDGHNALFIASLKPKFYHLVEADSIGYQEICNLFKANNFNKNVSIENAYIENLNSKNLFDLVLCEGMLPGLGKDAYGVLDVLDNHIRSNGVLVATCADEISYFYEQARRTISSILFTKNKVNNFEEKKDILIKLFSSHLATFQTTTKSIENWCLDMLSDISLEHSLSIADIINHFKDSYYFYNSSPSIVIDKSWYKEVETNIKNFNENKLNSFYDTWHNLFHYKVFNHNPWLRSDIFLLKKLCVDFRFLSKKTEEYYDKNLQNDIVINIELILKLFKKYNSSELILDSLQEFIEFIKKDKIDIHSATNDLKSFKSAFGRGQQYISLIKK